MKRVLKHVIKSPPIMAAIVSFILMCMVLLIHPLIGVADNGDFYRSINGQGIYKLDRYENDQFFDYFSSKYGLLQYYSETQDSIFSVQNYYIQAAKVINSIFTSDKTIFDIRCLSIILIIEMTIAIYMLVSYITFKRGKKEGMFLAAMAVFVFVDTAYIAYFNSFYAEGIVYVSFLLLIASALLMTQERYSPYLLLTVIFINGLILILTKQQNATEGFVLLVLCILMAFFFGIKRKHFKKIVLGCGCVLMISGILMYIAIPESFVYINQYHAMTRGVLMTSENPEETLDEFGINEQYSILNKTIYFERYPAADVEGQQLIDNFYSRYGFVPITAYYLTHPKQLAEILNIAAQSGYMIRPDAQGNYERSAGKEPGAKTEFFTLYSNFKRIYMPKTVGFVVVWLLAVLFLNFKDRKKKMVILCAVLMGTIQVGTSIIGAGDADLAKHVFLYNVAFDLVSYISFATVISAFTHGMTKFIGNVIAEKRKSLAGAKEINEKI